MSRISNAIPLEPTLPASTGGGSGDLRDLQVGQFMDLLIAELQNQDPLDPMDNSEMLQQISQIREISSTDRLTDTLSSVQLGQNMATAGSLIGRSVTALNNAGDEVNGIVDRVSVDRIDGKSTVRVHIGEHEIGLTNIRGIEAAG